MRLYVLTNQHIYANIIESLSQWDISEYEWLQQNIAQANTAEYQQNYKKFWTMYPARLSSYFYKTYFDFLSSRTAPSLPDLCRALHEASVNVKGHRSLQFSFATKLLHTFNPQLPIYDSFVARFFWFEPPSSDRPLEERIIELTKFYEFLKAEYARVINTGPLKSAIDAFRQQFSPERHTDEKILDWLIWRFAELAGKGALLKGKIMYA